MRRAYNRISVRTSCDGMEDQNGRELRHLAELEAQTKPAEKQERKSRAQRRTTLRSTHSDHNARRGRSSRACAGSTLERCDWRPREESGPAGTAQAGESIKRQGRSFTGFV